jgi:hypothetical protein
MPNIRLGGVETHYYVKSGLLKIVKVEVAIRFLQEVLT